MKLTYHVGDTIHARLYDAREIVGRVVGIEETVAGRKVRIVSGACVRKLDASQIVRVIHPPVPSAS